MGDCHQSSLLPTPDHFVYLTQIYVLIHHYIPLHLISFHCCTEIQYNGMERGGVSGGFGTLRPDLTATHPISLSSTLVDPDMGVG